MAQTIQNAGSISGSNIGVSINSDGNYTSGLANNGSASNFFSDDPGLYPVISDGELTFGSTTGINSYSALKAAIQNVGTTPTSFTLSGDCVDDSSSGVITVAAGQDITINLNGHKIDRNQKGRVINNSGTLTITDAANGNGEITGGYYENRSDYWAGAGIYNSGTL